MEKDKAIKNQMNEEEKKYNRINALKREKEYNSNL